MKKILCILLSIVCATSLWACGSAETKKSDSNSENKKEVIQTEDDDEYDEDWYEEEEDNIYTEAGLEEIEEPIEDEIINITNRRFAISKTTLYEKGLNEYFTYELKYEPARLSEKSCNDVIIENKDGSHSFIEGDFRGEKDNRLAVEGVNIKEGHKVVGAYRYKSDIMRVFTICDGKLYLTEYDKDGNSSEVNYQEIIIKEELDWSTITPVASKLIDFSINAINKGAYLFENGEYRKDRYTNIVEIDRDENDNINYSAIVYSDGLSNVSKIYSQIADYYEYVFVLNNDDKNIYTDWDGIENTVSQQYALPDNYTTNDIADVIKAHHDIVIFMNDGSVYSLEYVDIGGDSYEQAFVLNESLTNLYKDKKIIDAASMSSELVLLGSDGKMYER